MPVYLRKRHTERTTELERELESPFSKIAILSGQEGTQVQVATLKALLVAVPAGAPFPKRELQLHQAIMKPRDFVVRVYILAAQKLAHRDAASASDPYLRLSLGATKLDNRAEYLSDETDPHFHAFFEFRTALPGESLLQIDVMDHDIASLEAADDLIGSTVIDLEDRVFSSYWANCLAEAPPVEWRSLYSPLSKHEQGKLSLWVDVLRAERAKAVPPFNIALAPPVQWQLRVVVWSGMDLPTNVDDSGLADWYVMCRFADCPKQHSDTHFRAARGKASWNWRFKFDVTMSQFMKNQRLVLQIWDRDITADDCGGEAVLDLTRPWFRRVFGRKKARPTYWEPFHEEWNQRQTDKRARLRSQAEMRELGLGKFSTLVDVAEEVRKAARQGAASTFSRHLPPSPAFSHLLPSQVFAKESLLSQEVDEDLEAAKFWLPLRRPLRETAKQRESDSQGRGAFPKLLVSVQLVPIDEVEKLPAGFGRSAPNSNPVLPKPTGRLKFTLNPFAMMYRLLGPKLCGRLSAFICCILFILLLWYLIPIIIGNVITAPVTG